VNGSTGQAVSGLGFYTDPAAWKAASNATFSGMVVVVCAILAVGIILPIFIEKLSADRIGMMVFG
jgi:hypothetical protein